VEILVLNCGSSSLKWAVLDPTQSGVSASGLVERIGATTGSASAKLFSTNSEPLKIQSEEPFPDHEAALGWVAERLNEWKLTQRIAGVGHRVVHGAEVFSASTALTPDVLAQVERCNPLAPLHNPANLTGIRVAQKLFPELPQIGVFDTAFHQTLPPKAFRYAVPNALYQQHGVRRYGFHGSSHRFVAGRAQELMGNAQAGLVILHLGNGCSGAAVYAGQSLDTTMGLTPLEGLVMGTRTGDIDPGIAPYLQARLGWDLDKINAVYNKEYGLLGL
jgi:acetate kinase